MRAFHHNPVFPVLGLCLSAHSLAFPVLYHIAGIHLVLKNTVYGRVRPVKGAVQTGAVSVIIPIYPFVFGRAYDAGLIQQSRDTDFSISFDIEIEDFADNPGGIFVNNQFVFIGGRFPVAIGSESPYKFPRPLFGFYGSMDFF